MKHEYPYALQYFTGSKEHNIELRSRANSQGLSLNEYGFSKLEKHKPVHSIPDCGDEKDVYASLGLAIHSAGTARRKRGNTCG